MKFEWQQTPQVSGTLLSILADLKNRVVWMVSTRPFISKSSNPFINPLGTIPRALITISKNVTFIFHRFFNSLARSRYLSFFSFSFNFIALSVECSPMIQATGVQSQVESYQRQKKVLDLVLFYAQNHKVKTKGKVGHPAK